MSGQDDGLRWIDHHCHLDDGADGMVQRARNCGVVHLVDVGTDVDGSRRALARAAQDPMVSATAGVHPHDAAQGLDGLDELLGSGSPVAVGECGLDYHYDHSPRPIQRDAFARQIALAHEHRLPLVIHSRDAWADTFSILDAEGTPARTVFHCFTGGPDELDAALDRGALVSFSGIVTFANATDVQAAARACPLERLLVETDTPYLAPVPHRGKPNEPAWVGLVGARVAELKGIATADVSAATVANAAAFYDIATGGAGR